MNEDARAGGYQTPGTAAGSQPWSFDNARDAVKLGERSSCCTAATVAVAVAVAAAAAAFLSFLFSLPHILRFPFLGAPLA